MFLIMSSSTAFSQDEEEDEYDAEDEMFTIDTPITIDLEKEEEEDRVEPRKKKRKRNVFYGIKTKKGFTKNGFGDNVVIELFHYLKDYQDPDPYVRNIYWYDFRRKAIRSTRKVNTEYGAILHGPYKKMRGDQILEEGIFYVGTKHGRWTTYNRNNILIDKKKYYKGWPKESLVSYYDQDREKLKEIIPIQYGKKEGDYYYFHENGNIAVMGQYQNDVKVGKWTEYYKRRGRRKKVIQYRNDPYNDNFSPYIWREWNSNGELVYDRDVWAKRLSNN